jgi:hypothetical protein
VRLLRPVLHHRHRGRAVRWRWQRPPLLKGWCGPHFCFVELEA